MQRSFTGHSPLHTDSPALGSSNQLCFPSLEESSIPKSCWRKRWHRKGSPPQNMNYLLEDGPLVVQASFTRWVFQGPICISVLAGIVVRGCIWLQWIFLKTFNTFAHFIMGDLQGHLPTLCWVFSRFCFFFLPKMAWPPCLALPIHPISPQGALFVCLFPWMKKFSKGNVLPMWKR